MLITTVTQADLGLLSPLTPEGWPDITPSFLLYSQQGFCYPIKVVDADQIVGLGVGLMYGDTAWLAHIIVHPEHRNKGLGHLIVDHLIKFLRDKHIKTISLIATELGEPVYKKFGFETVTEYIFYGREETIPRIMASGNIVAFTPSHINDVTKLICDAYGEARDHLIRLFLKDAQVYIDSKTEGVYLPTCSEGLIIAQNEEAGLALMQLKAQSSTRFALPVDNLAGNKFLLDNGFSESRVRAKKMVLGPFLSCRTENIYSRAGGNFG